MGDRSDHREFISPEVGTKLAEGHNHREGGTDWSPFPTVNHAHHLPLLTLKVKGLSPMVRMGEDDHTGTHIHPITRLHTPS
jgi:hypothetical protein